MLDERRAKQGRHFLAAVLMAGLSAFFCAGPALAQSAQQERGAAEGAGPANTLGIKSQAEIWRAIRHGEPGQVAIPDKKAAQLIQPAGGAWRAWRNGPLFTWGVRVLGGMLALLVLFFLLRGRIRIEHGRANTTISRFSFFERTGHWLLAGSFIILAFSGLNMLYGRYFLPALIGKEAFATLTGWGKFFHNYVAFAFMAGLAWVFVMWVLHNLPNRHDFVWLAKGGGLFVKGVHPPSRKFNAGQKFIFWLTVLGGLSMSLSGWTLLFPYSTTMFTDTFVVVNGAFGTHLPTPLTALEEQQYAQLWHGTMAVILAAVIIAHIYIGTIGMEGAFQAMGSGKVDLNWAREHHNLWVDEVQARNELVAKTSPAE
jgi:formate dehydrogenase subunit gamma